MMRLTSTCLLFFALSNAQASPTYNEFERCNKMATSKLAYCLDEAKRSGYGKCWDKSRKTYDNCASDIFSLHYPPKLTPQQQADRDELLRLIETGE